MSMGGPSWALGIGAESAMMPMRRRAMKSRDASLTTNESTLFSSNLPGFLVQLVQAFRIYDVGESPGHALPRCSS